jgi:hypothetical protein
MFELTHDVLIPIDVIDRHDPDALPGIQYRCTVMDGEIVDVRLVGVTINLSVDEVAVLQEWLDEPLPPYV